MWLYETATCGALTARRLVVAAALVATLSTALASGQANLVFDDGVESGDLWAWDLFEGGSTGVGPCLLDPVDDGEVQHHVDPNEGDDVTGDGTPANPWASLQHVIDNEVACTDRFGTPRNPGAPVQGGDVIVLEGELGHDQDLQITGCYNSSWVTIRSSQPRVANIRSVHFRGSGYWRLEGLSFTNDGGGTMIRIDDHGTHGPALNIELDGNHFTSGALLTVDDWLEKATDAMRIYSVTGPVVVRCNHLERVAMGFVVGANNTDVINNEVEYFSRDGIATGGHHNRFVGNRIYDAVSLGDGHHDDFFQSHMGAGLDTSSDIEVTGNVFMNRYGPGQPAETWSPTQCLSGFEDGPKERIKITNNVCKGDHWHGITWYDTNNSEIVNNTVIGGSNFPGLPPGSSGWPTRTWITIEGTGNTVRNNLTSRNLAGGDHNHEIVADDLDDYFVNWLGEDLRLAPDSPAIDDGNPVGAATHDIEGRPRDSTPDVGAYEAPPSE